MLAVGACYALQSYVYLHTNPNALSMMPPKGGGKPQNSLFLLKNQKKSLLL